MRGSTLPPAPTNSDSQKAVDLRKYRNLGFSEFLIKISAKSLVFGTTRSPRRVEHFSFLAQRIMTVRFPYIEEKRKKRKKNIYSLTVSRLSHFSFRLRPNLFHFYPLFIYLFLYLKWDPHVIFFFHFLVYFSSETNHFFPVSISFIIIEYSLNIYHFSIFF